MPRYQLNNTSSKPQTAKIFGGAVRGYAQEIVPKSENSDFSPKLFNFRGVVNPETKTFYIYESILGVIIAYRYDSEGVLTEIGQKSISVVPKNLLFDKFLGGFGIYSEPFSDDFFDELEPSSNQFGKFLDETYGYVLDGTTNIKTWSLDPSSPWSVSGTLPIPATLGHYANGNYYFVGNTGQVVVTDTMFHEVNSILVDIQPDEDIQNFAGDNWVALATSKRLFLFEPQENSFIHIIHTFQFGNIRAVGYSSEDKLFLVSYENQGSEFMVIFGQNGGDALIPIEVPFAIINFYDTDEGIVFATGAGSGQILTIDPNSTNIFMPDPKLQNKIEKDARETVYEEPKNLTRFTIQSNSRDDIRGMKIKWSWLESPYDQTQNEEIIIPATFASNQDRQPIVDCIDFVGKNLDGNTGFEITLPPKSENLFLIETH